MPEIGMTASVDIRMKRNIILFSNPFWCFGCNYEVSRHIDRLIDSKPTRYNVDFDGYRTPLPYNPQTDDFMEWLKRNSARRPPIQDYCDEPDAFDENGTLCPKYRCDLYPAKLTIGDPAFTYDFFEQQGVYVSEKFRDMLKIPENSVEYVSLDDSQCPSELREKKYMIMRVIAFRDVIDIPKSQGFSDVPPFINPRDMPHNPLRFVFKNIEIDVPLFFDFRFPRTLSTDAFAEEALRSGLTGFKFSGYNNPDGTDKVFYKSIEDCPI
jgi:hypothetical protein